MALANVIAVLREILMMDPEPPARTYLKVSIRFNQVLRAPPNQ